MFFNLPHEIIRLIYSFDCTYKLQFDKVLEDIQRYQIYKNTKLYYIYDQQLQIMHCTDSLVRPNWICSSFRISREQMKNTIREDNLIRLRKDTLHYDIEHYEFHDEESIHSLFTLFD